MKPESRDSFLYTEEQVAAYSWIGFAAGAATVTLVFVIAFLARIAFA